jgi:ribosome maturation factor RimP
MLTDLKTDLTRVIEPIVETEGFDLVEVKLARFKRSYRVQVFIDIDGGVTIEHCAHLSNLVGAALDLVDMIAGAYILEVSSPGLDRPLHTARDFRRRIGERIEVRIVADRRETTVKGTLTGVENDTLALVGETGVLVIALVDVQQGKVII